MKTTTTIVRSTIRCTLGSALGVLAGLSISGAPGAALAQGAAAPAPAAAAPEAGKPEAEKAEPVLNTKHHNLRKGLALKGYDPVAYHPEGGSKPAKGLESITVVHQGETFRFANAGNAEMFRANPAKYLPTYGGWCAWAVAKGDKVSIDPTAYTLEDGQLYLFYSQDQVEDWTKAAKSSRAKADAWWTKTTGERREELAARAAAVEAAKKAAAAGPVVAGPLATKLDAMRASFEASAPAEMKAAFEQGLAEVRALNLETKSLNVGAKAPEFSLPAAGGAMVSLAQARATGPVVVTFYRGGWCPYCNLQLKALAESAPEFEAAGARMIAISPELPDRSLSTKQTNQLPFDVLSDTGNAVARQFAIAYTLPNVVTEQFKGRLDLAAYNGAEAPNDLPLTATYVIAQDGTIAWRSVTSDYRQRAEPSEVLAAVKALSASGSQSSVR
jgi:peroxiredoxin